MKERFLQIAYTQKETLKAKTGLIERDLMPLAKQLLLSDNRVLIVTGMRRVGKSTLLQQLMATLDNYCYFNFEDEKLLGFTVAQFGELEEALIEVYGASDNWFFDEYRT